MACAVVPPEAIHVTQHAVQRYQERVSNLPDEQVRASLAANPAVRRAVNFGAPFVKLPGGQRVVLYKGRVITILPKDHYAAALDRRRDAELGHFRD